LAYNPNVPQANQELKDTQQPMLDNFGILQTTIEQNHSAMNGANPGKHEFIQFINRTGNTPVFNGFEGLWAQNGTFTGVPEIWVNTTAGLGFNQYQMTASVLSNTPLVANNADGWTSLPSGIVMKWGRVVVNGVTIVNLNAIGQPFVATFSAQATANAVAAINVWVVSLLPNQLQLNCSPVNQTVYWFVIGRF
jgi:hypothetical protein